MNPEIALIGDSDISYWPSELYPCVEGATLPVISSGHSGATLQDILQHLQTLLKSYDTKPQNNHDRRTLILVACAGENDIGDGIPLDASVRALESFIEIVFGDDNNNKTTTNRATRTDKKLIFLGPKLIKMGWYRGLQE